MTTPFDLAAADYRRLWSEAPAGRSQRSQVWRHVDPLFRPGDRILDLGCGTGDDALHWAARGVRVCGVDASERMVEAAQARGVKARRLALEDLRLLEGAYSGAISNFGVLNCVADPGSVATQLARLVEPGGAVALCVMGRFAPWETFRFLCRGQWRKAARRWRGHASWRGMDVYYRSSREMRSAFASGFAFGQRRSIGWGDHQLYVFRRTG